MVKYKFSLIKGGGRAVDGGFIGWNTTNNFIMIIFDNNPNPTKNQTVILLQKYF